MMIDVEYNLELMQEFLSCRHNLYLWRYTPAMKLISTTCPDSQVYHALFAMEPGRTFHPQEIWKEHRTVIFTNAFGLMWCADFCVRQGILTDVILLGPIFYSEVSAAELQQKLDLLNLSLSVKYVCINALGKLPVIQTTHFYEYAQMLHLFMTGEKCLPTDFIFKSSGEASSQTEAIDSPTHHGNRQVEEMVMKLVEDGNINYREAFARYSTMANLGSFGDGTPTRQIKNQNIILVALITRAAIRGGLPAETAYTLSDLYIQKIEALKEIAELNDLVMIIMDDFISRVHQAKTDSHISNTIRACMDYITFHITESLSVPKLAALVGYTDNYLSQKFKTETGTTLSEYILNVKMEYAKRALLSDDATITHVAEMLGFDSLSYFAKQFKRVTGMTPTEYRLKGDRS